MKVGKNAADCESLPKLRARLIHEGLVIEDAISGLISGRAAGAKTMAVCTSTTRQQILSQVIPDFVVADLTKSVFRSCDALCNL